MPSYGSDAKGLKIDGVRKDGPAEKAGIKKGDIIISIKGKDRSRHRMITFNMVFEKAETSLATLPEESWVLASPTSTIFLGGGGLGLRALWTLKIGVGRHLPST